MTIIAVALLMGVAAALYSSVGHGGASAYLGIMALFAVVPEVMRPTALALNLVVAGFGTWRYLRARQFNPRLFLAFAVTAIPMAYLGGRIHVPPEVYRPMLGAVLWFAAARMLWRPRATAARTVRSPSLALSLPGGAVLGLLAGLTGTGGGIFLSPLILLFAWEEPRRTSGVAAAFILVNSIAGLAGQMTLAPSLPPGLPVFVAAVAAGAVAGTWLGMKRLPQAGLLITLGVVLALAGAKLIFT
ncbi:MAG: sulfite exporter TauE/SafE family protein [Brevundimonas sp.]|uniref:Probable membrane transporter protein n=1 Tax=Brevundimonas albigilva TaxID=1312364 RepID=A0ABY4SJ56_9CAUL|nr:MULTISPECIES: sulfite exporter TauE/SafE family protein [Brevundimonas]MCV0416558.1 sulfite exporter TauE/SafE family protein [Brevundimonas sp.]URI15011.1 sulfite exporter TauE/SafE family protein [Brevundimonas albigilva]